MKKFPLIALLSLQFANAQSTDSLAILDRKNEIRVDLLSAVAFTKFNLAYEHFFSKKLSLGLSLGYSDSQKLTDDFESGYRTTDPKYDFTPFARYNLSKSVTSFYFAEVFLSANGGDYKESVRAIDENGNGYYYNEKSTYFDIGAGGSLGYKLYLKEKFGIEALIGFGANLFNKDKSPDILTRVGLSVGYRF